MDWERLLTIDRTQFYFISITTCLYYTIGGFGNIISIVIFNDKLFKKQPATFYLNAACVMNLATILYLPIMFLAPIWQINSVTCKVYQGIFGLIIRFQAWVVATGSFDRLITTFQPKSFLWKNKRKNQIRILIILAFIIVTATFPCIYFADAVTIKNITVVCSFPMKAELSWIWPYYKIEYLFMRVFFPWLVMIVSSVLITYKMCSMKSRLNQTAERQRERQLFISLISYDVFFIAFRMPMVVYSFINQISASFFVSLTYCIYLAIGLMSNVFIFVVLIFFNKIYKKLFFQIMSCKTANHSKDNQVNARN